MAEAGHKTGSRYIAFGARSLAVATGCEHTTVAALLKVLADMGWVDLLEPAHGPAADLYALTIPPGTDADGLRWHPGKVHAKRPVFRELGDAPGLVFEALEHGRARTVSELVVAVGCARSSVSDALDMLWAYSLVERNEGGLVAQPGRLGKAGEDLGGDESVATQLAVYARQRRVWHAYLARHDLIESGGLGEFDVYDPEVAEYWLPPPDDLAT